MINHLLLTTTLVKLFLTNQIQPNHILTTASTKLFLSTIISSIFTIISSFSFSRTSPPSSYYQSLILINPYLGFGLDCPSIKHLYLAIETTTILTCLLQSIVEKFPSRQAIYVTRKFYLTCSQLHQLVKYIADHFISARIKPNNFLTLTSPKKKKKRGNRAMNEGKSRISESTR